MKMLLSLALLPGLAFTASAQDLRWSDLAVGDQVEIRFRSGGTIGGRIVPPGPSKEPVDFARETSLRLDVSVEYPGLDGSLTVSRQDIRSIRRWNGPSRSTPPPVDPQPEPARPAAKPVPAPTPEPAAAPAPAPDKAAKEAEELKKAVEFYGKYPSPYWGPERHTMNIQKRARGQALSPAEVDFEGGYPALWEKGRAASIPKKD